MVTVSIIVPVLNEENGLSVLLPSLANQENAEVIVSIGECKDGSLDLANRFCSKVISTNSGRANQMNEGAKAASGQILLFLHADSRISKNVAGKIAEVCRRPGVIGGALRLRIDSPRFSLRLIGWGANQRARYLNLPYGDQGIFIRKEVFEEIGRYPETPFMEDLQLVRKMARRGKLVILDEEILTSARRWEKYGVFRTTGTNLLLVSLYFLGFAPATLKRWYE